MDSFDVCSSWRPDAYLVAGALKPVFLLLATHLLAGEVDATLAPAQQAGPGPGAVGLGRRLFWLLRYYNPVNVSWRYYSILAWRASRLRRLGNGGAGDGDGDGWGPRHSAIVNHEAHPWASPPVPFVASAAGAMSGSYEVRRLEMAGDGWLGAQAVLTASAAYQLGLAALVVAGGGGPQLVRLPNLSMPLFALPLGLRVCAAPWIASKLYVKPHACPPGPTTAAAAHRPGPAVLGLSAAWALLLLAFVAFSWWPAPLLPAAAGDPDPSHARLSAAVLALYRFSSASHAALHAALVPRGPAAWANRVAFFDHWLYCAHTVAWLALLAAALALALHDLILHDFYRSCAAAAASPSSL